MEELYRKVGNRYELVGYSNMPDINEGIWLVQKTRSGRSYKNLVWRLGDIKPPVDVVNIASLMSLEKSLMGFLRDVGDENSEAYKELSNKLGGWLTGPVTFNNIPLHDLVDEILVHIGKQLK
jgi:hypothetical protein